MQTDHDAHEPSTNEAADAAPTAAGSVAHAAPNFDDTREVPYRAVPGSSAPSQPAPSHSEPERPSAARGLGINVGRPLVYPAHSRHPAHPTGPAGGPDRVRQLAGEPPNRAGHTPRVDRSKLPQLAAHNARFARTTLVLCAAAAALSLAGLSALIVTLATQ